MVAAPTCRVCRVPHWDVFPALLLEAQHMSRGGRGKTASKKHAKDRRYIMQTYMEEGVVYVGRLLLQAPMYAPFHNAEVHCCST